MCVALMWTLNDFSAYWYLSDCSTIGDKACPTCNENTSSVYLRDKVSYVGHRRLVPTNHPWKSSRDFKGKQ